MTDTSANASSVRLTGEGRFTVKGQAKMTEKTEPVEQLKPCPFCGAVARRSMAVTDDPISYAIGCSKCVVATEWLVSEAEAIAAWNQRTEQPRPTEAGDAGLAGELAALPYRVADLTILVPTKMRDRILSALTTREAGIERRYHELLYAVACKYEGEDRHETALRYIREREADREIAGGPALAAPAPKPEWRGDPGCP